MTDFLRLYMWKSEVLLLLREDVSQFIVVEVLAL